MSQRNAAQNSPLQTSIISVALRWRARSACPLYMSQYSTMSRNPSRTPSVVGTRRQRAVAPAVLRVARNNPKANPTSPCTAGARHTWPAARLPSPWHPPAMVTKTRMQMDYYQALRRRKAYPSSPTPRFQCWPFSDECLRNVLQSLLLYTNAQIPSYLMTAISPRRGSTPGETCARTTRVELPR